MEGSWPVEILLNQHVEFAIRFVKVRWGAKMVSRIGSSKEVTNLSSCFQVGTRDGSNCVGTFLDMRFLFFRRDARSLYARLCWSGSCVVSHKAYATKSVSVVHFPICSRSLIARTAIVRANGGSEIFNYYVEELP